LVVYLNLKLRILKHLTNALRKKKQLYRQEVLGRRNGIPAFNKVAEWRYGAFRLGNVDKRNSAQ